MTTQPANSSARSANVNVAFHTLANGVSVPMLGLGMDNLTDARLAEESVACALATGYRSVDTASGYQNEAAVGRAIAASRIARADLYITTKVASADHGFDNALRAFDRSCAALGLEYLDAYHIHWPGKYRYVDTWRALIRLLEERRVRVIGVCNFLPHHLDRLFEETGVLPLVDQVEWHPYFAQTDVAAYAQSHAMLVEAWSPLMVGGPALEDSVIRGIAAEVGRSPAQVVLRWHTQRGRRVFPKSVTPTRIAENLRIFEFSLTGDQLAAIDALAWHKQRIGPNPEIFFMR